MSSAPGRRELRWFALSALLASCFNVSNVFVTMPASEPLRLVTSRLNVFFGGLHAVVWFMYSAAQERRRLRRYSTRPSGTGLGLAVVKSCADAHGGSVALMETPGGGATFMLRFPRRS